jgi:hypothetical protein
VLQPFRSLKISSVQILASKIVVMISSKLAQYSEGVKKFGIGCPPTSTEGPPIIWFFSRNGGEDIKVLFYPVSIWLYACILRAIWI